MTIFYVGKMDGDTFVPDTPTENYGKPTIHNVYVGGGNVREFIGVLSGGRVAMVDVEGEARQHALEHLWNFQEEENDSMSAYPPVPDMDDLDGR